jgi:hypothetical protein
MLARESNMMLNLGEELELAQLPDSSGKYPWGDLDYVMTMKYRYEGCHISIYIIW